MPLPRDYANFLTTFSSEKFTGLWPAQAHVLDAYAQSFSDRPDVAVELPTGAGKTLIALLIAEAWRQEGRKVAILSANKTLARQMLSETQELDMPAILMEGRGVDIPARDKRNYHRARHIAVMNYWVYLNQNPVLDPADLLIMDDAHLAEHCLHSLYSVEINQHDHQALFRDIVTELANRFPDYAVLHDALDDDQGRLTPPELLSFLDQSQTATRLREIIDASPLLEQDDDLRFRWNRLRNHFDGCNVYLSTSSIWLRPYIYPLRANSHYADSTQRLYMSATIGQPSDLCRRLGTRPVVKIPVPADYAEATSGRRLIVMNRIEDTDLPERLQWAILAALRTHPKSVWMCTSRSIAERIRDIVSPWLDSNGFVGHPAWTLTSLGNEIDEFKQSQVGHLFVAGRFDGMDFRGDECRLVVLTTLPRAVNIQEEFLCAYLRDATFMVRRMNQRIVQALGRCNRSDDDFAMYVLADRRFATHFGRESQRQGIPPNIVAEIDMAGDMAEIDEDELSGRVGAFLSADFARYDAEYQELLNDIEETPRNDDSDVAAQVVDDEVMGWTAMFHSQNYDLAAQRFGRCYEAARRANLIELGAFYGWCQAKALHLSGAQGNAAAQTRSLEVFRHAVERGGRSSWFNRMKASLNRATVEPVNAALPAEEFSHAAVRALDELLERVGCRGTRFDDWFNRLRADLLSEHHDQFVAGLKRLGELIGYGTSRPRHSAAADCRWRGAFGDTREVITFEAKIEHSGGAGISATDIGQAHNQCERAKTEYERLGYQVRGTIVTHLDGFEGGAESSVGLLRVLQKEAVLALCDRARSIANRYRESWSLDDVNARMGAGEAVRPLLPPSGWLVRILDADELFIASDHLLQEWPALSPN